MSYRRPRFVREESWRYKRVKEPWRAPHGKTSRVRRSKKGWPAVVKIGYSRPRATRGLHPSGLREVLVWRAKDLIGLDPKLQVARIAHTVGENKRVQIIDEAKKANIRVLNPGLKKPAEALPEVPAEPTVGEPTPSEPTPETKEGTAEVKPKETEPAKQKPKKKTKPKTATKRKSKK
ncbi:MAG: 50S ribosomal protein L32e [Candidatus Bathyarchaeia archaeon]